MGAIVIHLPRIEPSLSLHVGGIADHGEMLVGPSPQWTAPVFLRFALREHDDPDVRMLHRLIHGNREIGERIVATFLPLVEHAFEGFQANLTLPYRDVARILCAAFLRFLHSARGFACDAFVATEYAFRQTAPYLAPSAMDNVQAEYRVRNELEMLLMALANTPTELALLVSQASPSIASRLDIVRRPLEAHTLVSDLTARGEFTTDFLRGILAGKPAAF